jgi:DNA topoisomerase I
MRLRRSDCASPGISRHRQGRGFTYRDAEGRPVRDTSTLERIRSLGIPPAWTEVWICQDERGHLQATGLDAAGRKQYLYHPDWRMRRDHLKFDRMLDFAIALPRLRRQVARDIARDDLCRERTLACALRLLDRGFFRIGGEGYADENGTFGLATLRRDHVDLGPAPVLVFDFRAKGGVRRRQQISDGDVYDVLRVLKRRRSGKELLAYRKGGTWIDVRSSDINAYLRFAAGGDFSAKDFRTWTATALAAVSLAVLANGRPASVSARGRAVTHAVRDVARYLGNTPAVCRASYIDPRVVDRFHAGVTVGGVLDRVGDWMSDSRAQREIESAVVDLLQGDLDVPALEKWRP